MFRKIKDYCKIVLLGAGCLYEAACSKTNSEIINAEKI